MPREHYNTLQQVFDDAYLGLAAQGFGRSLNDEGHCAYRGIDGARCAIGHCIPDGLYGSEMEGASANPAPGTNSAAESIFDFVFGRIDRRILSKLQSIHDGGSIPWLMKQRLQSFAADHGLTVPAVPN